MFNKTKKVIFILLATIFALSFLMVGLNSAKASSVNFNDFEKIKCEFVKAEDLGTDFTVFNYEYKCSGWSQYKDTVTGQPVSNLIYTVHAYTYFDPQNEIAELSNFEDLDIRVVCSVKDQYSCDFSLAQTKVYVGSDAKYSPYVKYDVTPAASADTDVSQEMKDKYSELRKISLSATITDAQFSTATGLFKEIDAEAQKIAAGGLFWHMPNTLTAYAALQRQTFLDYGVVRTKHNATKACEKYKTDKGYYGAMINGSEVKYNTLEKCVAGDPKVIGYTNTQNKQIAIEEELQKSVEGSGFYKDGLCVDGTLSDVGDLIKNFPQGMICFMEQGALGGIEWGFSKIDTTFSNILIVGGHLEGDKIVIAQGEALSDNDVVKTVSDLFVTFINTLFLLVALISILVTTLKIDLPGLSLNSWQLKRMIPTIIATMVLVNYSLSIVNLIITIMNYLVVTFMGTVVGTGEQFFKFGTDIYKANASIGTLAIRIIALLAFLIITVYLMCLLWIRKIMLIIFYMFAPVPWLSSIIPVDAVKKITNKFWEPFMNWALMGPMVAILLRAAAVAITATTAAAITTSLGALPIKETGGVGEGGGLSLISMILTGVLLYLAATMPLKLGGDIMKSVQGAVSGKKGGKINPMTSIRKGTTERIQAKGEQIKKGFVSYANKATPGGMKELAKQGKKPNILQKAANKALNMAENPKRSLDAEKKRTEMAQKVREKQNYDYMNKYDTTDTAKIEEDAKKFDGSTADYTFQSAMTSGNPNTKLSAMEKSRRVAMGIDQAANDAEKAKHTEMWNYYKRQHGSLLSDTEIVGGPNSQNVKALRTAVQGTKTVDKRVADIGKFGGDPSIAGFLDGYTDSAGKAVAGIDRFDVNMMGKDVLTAAPSGAAPGSYVAHFDDISTAAGLGNANAQLVVDRAKALRGGDTVNYVAGLLKDAGGDDAVRQQTLNTIQSDFTRNIASVSGTALVDQIRDMGPQFKSVKSVADAIIIRDQLAEALRLHQAKDAVNINKMKNAAL